jgi:hypothetical protein
VKDHTSVFVAPVFKKIAGRPHLAGWRYEVLHNGRFVASGDGFATVAEARQAGKEAWSVPDEADEAAVDEATA